MALQFSVSVRNAMLDAYEASIGPSPTLKLFTGDNPPATCADPDAGTVLATVALPADWMAAASGGVKLKSGLWEDLSADNGGTAGHFRIYSGATCVTQGLVRANGDPDAGLADMIILPSRTIIAGRIFTVSTYGLTAPGA